MISASFGHPRPEQLAAYGLGKTDAFEEALIHQHLEVCPDCRAKVQELPDDTLASLVRKVQQDPGS